MTRGNFQVFPPGGNVPPESFEFPPMFDATIHAMYSYAMRLNVVSSLPMRKRSQILAKSLRLKKARPSQKIQYD